MLRCKSLSKGIGFPIVLQKHLHSKHWLATLTFVDGLVNPTSHARYTLEIAPEVTRYVVGFTSPSTKVRVANHWSTCNLVTINLMPPKAFGGLKIIRGGSVPRNFPGIPRGGP